MSKFKKAICYVFAVFLALQSFIISPSTINAQNPTPPQPATDECKQIIEEGKTKIQCTRSGKSVKFTHLHNVLFAPTIGTNKKWQAWVTPTIAGEQFYLLVNADPILSTTGLTIDSMAIKITSERCTQLGASKCDSTRLLTNDVPDLSNWICFLNANSGGWNDIKPASGTQPELSVLQWVADTTKGNAKKTIIDFHREAPDSVTLASCGGSKIQPRISATEGGATGVVQSIKEQMISSVNSAGMDDASKQTALSHINSIFSDPNRYFTENEDKEWYRVYYSTVDPATYPNVPVTTTLVDRFGEMITGLATLQGSIGFNPYDHWGVIGDTIYRGSIRQQIGTSMITGAGIGVAVGIAAAAAGAGVVAGIGGTAAIAGGGIGNMITLMQNNNEAKELLKRIIKITIVYTYLKQNLAFNKCAQTAGDDWAMYDEALDRRVDSLMGSTADSLNGLNTNPDNGETVCDKLKGIYIVVMLKQAFCGLMIITKEWADTAYNYSISLLASSIGVATDDNARIDEMEKAEGVKVGPYTTSDGGSSGDTGGVPGGNTGATTSGSCAMVSETFQLRSGAVTLPKEGRIVKEAHLVTTGDTAFASRWPSSTSENIQEHFTVTQNAIGRTYNHTGGWTPAEGGNIGQGSSSKPPANVEPWVMNMYWTTRPPAGKRVIIKAGDKAVVAAAGYETGPSTSYLLGAQEEVLQALGAVTGTTVTVGFAQDQNLQYGPINCTD